MIKLILSDMDGTLLDEAGQLPAEFDAMMEKLHDRGVMFAPASGRQYYSLVNSFPKYADTFLFVSDNGTMVRQHGEELFSDVIERDRAMEIVNSVNDKPDIYNVFCGKKKVYLLKDKQPEKYMDELMKYFSEIELVDCFEEVDDEPIKISFFTADGDADTKIFPLLKHYESSMQVVLASAYWVDITNLGANKGMAVRKIQERLGLAPEECAAFGDYMNDKEMLESVYYSYAMANAYPAIKDVARFTAKSNAEAGVMVKIQQLLDAGLC
ncbi:hypothetical protein SAMN05216584_10939 [Selenomonas sp. WCT3]|uniref:HAD family hydrolase n=1 Tax=Selenomonas sp. WCT3 TaxID=3158785 RepID=UPI000886F534|nr:hypothetical protein SAMN05216584_10939 [Selenomonas ruminantium]